MVEDLHPEASASNARVCIFDFDGTISLIRSGWMDVMVPMMVEILAARRTGESEEELRRVVEDFVWRLTGEQTIYQMIELADQVRSRGGQPLDPLVYKKMYLDRLNERIRHRLEELRSGSVSPDKYLVPGTRDLVRSLRERGLTLYLASGTDQEYMREEARLLEIDSLFDGGVYGALDDYRSFSKRILVQRLISETGVRGEELLAFGDGYVEIQDVKEVGGVAVGVASAEPECLVIDEWKRRRLADVGADFIIPNFLCREELLDRLFSRTGLPAYPGPAGRPVLQSKYSLFDRSRLRLRPLSERVHDLHLDHWLALDEAPLKYAHPQLPDIASRLAAARRADAARILIIGAHVLRAGVNRQIIDLLERGFIDHIAMNGAGAIHDYELARAGATTESVARYIRSGEFGLWRETGELNDWIGEAAAEHLGLGENVGRRIEESDFPHRGLSVLAAAWRLSVPVTVHAGIGYDIIHEHPSCDGAALGAASYRDFLIFARAVERLEGGVVLAFGSAVMAPEVYLKALAMARNVAHQEGREIRRFTTAVFDLVPIEGDIHHERPKSDPAYYFRPYKTILVRTVADGGESYYFCGDHRATFPALRRAILQQP